MLAESVLGNVVARRPLAAKTVGDAVWERATRRGWTSLDLESFQSVRNGPAIRAARALRALSLRRVDRVIAPSEYTARLVKGWTSHPPPSTVIYNAAPGVNELPLDDPLPHVAHPRIVMAGRLIPLKRIDGVIRALHRIPRASLIIVGAGEEEAGLRALAASDRVGDRVTFTGGVPSHEVLRILQHSDLLVLNSSTENCPHVILEALAVGLPIVATRVGGVPELVEDGVTGHLIDPADPSQLVDRINDALADDGWRRQASVSARAAASRFTWRTHADAVDRLLRTMAQAA